MSDTNKTKAELIELLDVHTDETEAQGDSEDLQKVFVSKWHNSSVVSARLFNAVRLIDASKFTHELRSVRVTEPDVFAANNFSRIALFYQANDKRQALPKEDPVVALRTALRENNSRRAKTLLEEGQSERNPLLLDACRLALQNASEPTLASALFDYIRSVSPISDPIAQECLAASTRLLRTAPFVAGRGLLTAVMVSSDPADLLRAVSEWPARSLTPAVRGLRARLVRSPRPRTTELAAWCRTIHTRVAEVHDDDSRFLRAETIRCWAQASPGQMEVTEAAMTDCRSTAAIVRLGGGLALGVTCRRSAQAAAEVASANDSAFLFQTILWSESTEANPR